MTSKPKTRDSGTAPDDQRDRSSDTDTASYAQTQGAPGKDNPPNRRQSRMPHERDESAAATGDRLNENPVPSDRQISDAREDVESGRVDTDRRGIPNDVPTRKSKESK